MSTALPPELGPRRSRRIAFTTLGCKVNQSETDLYARRFASVGYQCVAFGDFAEVYVVNTCTVTHVADRKSRQLLAQAKRSNPDALVVAIGCYASVVGDVLADARTMVVRQRDKERLVSLVDGALGRAVAELPYHAEPEKYVDVLPGYTRRRAMVKVQDGCDSHCTYCIIPRARGRSRSVAPEDIARRINCLVAEGHAEVVITGVDLGSYGDDAESLPDLGGLLIRILAETDVRRIRLSSLEPGDFKEDWLSLWENPRLCRHLHVPLQAGCKSVLKRMERKYTPSQFAAMVQVSRSSVADITITTDIMVGFPGETDHEFDEGFEFIRAIGFDGMHVFRYSPRSGTRAAHFSDQVSDGVKTTRSELLRTEAEAGVTRLLDRHQGTVARVAWEGEMDGVWRGLTDTNVRVYGSVPGLRSSELCRVGLTAPFADGLWGETPQADIVLTGR